MWRRPSLKCTVSMGPPGCALEVTRTQIGVQLCIGELRSMKDQSTSMIQRTDHTAPSLLCFDMSGPAMPVLCTATLHRT